jgi:hypothetical protein
MDPELNVSESTRLCAVVQADCNGAKKLSGKEKNKLGKKIIALSSSDKLKNPLSKCYERADSRPNRKEKRGHDLLRNNLNQLSIVCERFAPSPVFEFD